MYDGLFLGPGLVTLLRAIKPVTLAIRYQGRLGGVSLGISEKVIARHNPGFMTRIYDSSIGVLLRSRSEN